MSSAAWSTPFLTTDQNGSDACPCVTTAIVMSPRLWAPPPPSPPPPHPATNASANTTAAKSAARPFVLNLPTTLLLSTECPHLHDTSTHGPHERLAPTGSSLATRPFVLSPNRQSSSVWPPSPAPRAPFPTSAPTRGAFAGGRDRRARWCLEVRLLRARGRTPRGTCRRPRRRRP